MGRALERHDLLLRSCIEDRGGYVFKTVGDAFCAAFKSAGGAVNAALALQLALKEEEWPEEAVIQVRTALHSGEAIARDGDYFGVELSRVGRLLSASHGGQVLMSGATKELVQDHLPDDTALRPMGTHRLRDLSRTEDVYQLEHVKLDGEFPALKTLENLPNNLPRQMTSFVGRGQDLDDLEELFAKTGMLTLTGVGGTGKTRLALQFAADQLDSFEDGVWLVELAPLSDPDLVANEVAHAISLKEEPEKTMIETLTARLKGKEILIVLDNCEHLLDACAEIAEELLRRCKRLKILATSREGLGVGGEHTYRVRSLLSPKVEDATVDSLMEFDAARLFAERAVASSDGFEVTDENASAIAAVCRRLDGIPFAIELAAARMRSMTPQDVNDRLDQKFRLLTGGAKSGLKRHQTLRGLMDWSYDLLDEREQALLRRLSIFRGGWTLNASEKVCCDAIVAELDVIDVLSSLVDKSLVISESRKGSARYRMLETVRDYAAEKFVHDIDQPDVRDQHLEFFMLLAGDAEAELKGKNQEEWLDRLDDERDNIGAALDWATTSAERGNLGLRLAASLILYWDVRGFWRRGCLRYEALLDSSTDRAAARAMALLGLAWLRLDQGLYSAAKVPAEECLALSRELGDKTIEKSAVTALGAIAYRTGDYDQAQERWSAALAICQEFGFEHGVGTSLSNLSAVANARGEFQDGLDLGNRALDILHGHSSTWLTAMFNTGLALLALGQLSEAKSTFEDTVTLARKIGNAETELYALRGLTSIALNANELDTAKRLLKELTVPLRDLGGLRIYMILFLEAAHYMIKTSRADDASRLLGRATESARQIGTKLESYEQSRYESCESLARAMLADDDAFDAAWEEGRKMSLEEAVELAVSDD